MRYQGLGIVVALAASLVLVGCGDDTDEPAETTPAAAIDQAPPAMAAAPPAMDAAPPAMAAAPPAMDAAPPAMAAAPPAMDAAPPAMAAAPPADAVAGQLTLAAISGNWAASAAQCGTPAEVTVIAAEALTRGGRTCTVTGSNPLPLGIELTLSCTGGAAPVTETWALTTASLAPPITAIGVTFGTDTQALVRCP